MFAVVACEALEYRFGFGRTQSQGGRILDHLIVLLAYQLPVDRPPQHRLQVGIRVGLSGRRCAGRSTP